MAVSEPIPSSTERYDRDAAVKVDSVADLVRIDLISSHFESRPAGALDEPPSEAEPVAIGFDVKWEIDRGAARLGCLVSFGTVDSDEHALSGFASFRVLYTLRGAQELTDYEFDQFAWNHSVYSIWPYWREHIDSLSRSANQPSPLMPNMRPPSTT